MHADGIDFTLLSPRALAVMLFIAIPATFGAELEPLCDVVRRSMPTVPERGLLAVPILASGALVMIGPPGIALAGPGWVVRALGQGTRLGLALRSQPVAWAGRLGRCTLGG